MPRLNCTRLAVVGQGRGRPLRDAILSTATTATLSYIAAVEAADEQRLEDGVLAAMVTFANWRIPLGGACCLMTGPRTLAGALTPMVGPVPTGVNLVAGDYNRLRVQFNIVNKYINTDYNNNAMAQNSRHAAFWQHSNYAFQAGGRALFGGSSSVGQTIVFYLGSNSAFRARIASQGQLLTADFTGFNAGLFGIFRQSSSELTLRFNQSSTTSADASTTPANAVLRLGSDSFDGARSGIAPSIYSFGPYIDPADLDTHMTAAVNAITAALA